MSHPIPEDAQRLISRLRLLADELASAARYGVPVPSILSVSDTLYDYGVSWHVPNADEFNAWVDYTEATVERREHHGAVWHSFTADVNGLSIRLATDQVEPISLEVTP